MLLPYDEHHSATVRYLDRSGNDEILNYPLNYDEISDRDWLSLEDRDAEVLVSASLATSVAELIRLAEDARVLCVDPGPLHLLDDYKNAGMILNQDIYLDYRSYATVKLDEDDVRPESFALKQNYPNPFNPQTEISYSLEEESEVSLVIYNVVGQKVITLVEEKQQAGSHTIRFDGLDKDGREVASGMYFYRLTVDGVSKSRKMILMK
ncbi:MAG: T9SS type A sorting domain-containing protein [candidate division Zixibacteria bacterium]|nr:T9SS type A sorting domain-containing protein [candidate division Zixibacteria bacterium]